MGSIIAVDVILDTHTHTHTHTHTEKTLHLFNIILLSSMYSKATIALGWSTES